MIEPLARRVEPLGWHVQIHLRADQIVDAAGLLQRLPGTVVFDHLGRLRNGVDDPAFAVIRRMLDSGRTWMKLSGAYMMGQPPDYAEATRGRAGVYRGRARAHGVGQRLAASDREGQAGRRGAVRSARRTGRRTKRRASASWSTTRRSFTAFEQHRLKPRRAAVGARIVRAFERAVRMQHHRAGVAHRVGIGVRQHLDVVAGRHQPVDQMAVEARFHPQVGVRRAPGAAEQPARRVERLVERLAVTAHGA